MPGLRKKVLPLFKDRPREYSATPNMCQPRRKSSWPEFSASHTVDNHYVIYADLLV
ncbi:MAG TPA: hypothetical protein VJ783_27215 [Pirellulales bacterium]|nr:hypothetical protein [Pirellulales bacterium]